MVILRGPSAPHFSLTIAIGYLGLSGSLQVQSIASESNWVGFVQNGLLA